MDKSLFAFIWKHSRREQIVLLAVTILTFPLLYATLELPKRIINDAISAETPIIDVYGFEFSQIEFLLALSFAYLGAVLIHGLLKMRLNTMKGVLSERMLRRFRYQLLARMMRFPKPYFQRTSQGELVSMVTSEAEPMGGLMGDALAQPVFQAGQMLIIVTFLFIQSVWFGLAGVALIPLQAWLIPMLQRQINQLNKKRIIQVRALSSEISETAAGMSDLRLNGGWRYRRAQFTDRLGRIFGIRFQIYQKKFFMKFLNNFITQLTPFFFYSVGGVLAIRGEITVGALVAALAAYKDLSAPWKELLTYYNEFQDMSLRWEVVTERFAPPNMIDPQLFEGAPEEIPRLRGPISLKDVTVRNEAGNAVLEDLTLEIPPGAQVAVKVPNQAERSALADVLTREVLPSRGHITLAGHPLNELHQSVIAARIGYAQSRPYFFDGTLGSNLMMPLRTAPRAVTEAKSEEAEEAEEARRSGNSTDPTAVDWTDPALAEFHDEEEIRAWWFSLVKAMGIDDFMVRRMLMAIIDPEKHSRLAEAVVALRPAVWEAIRERGLDRMVYRFDPDEFNPGIPLGGNLLFAAPRVRITQERLASEGQILGVIAEQGLAGQAIAIAQSVVDTLHQAFGNEETQHPLFDALGISPELYEKLTDIAKRRRTQGDGAISEEEFALFLTVPFLFTAEQIGPAFPDSFKQEILDIRRKHGARLREAARDLFVPMDEETYLPRMSLLENLLYGRVSAMAGAHLEVIRDTVGDLLEERGLGQLVAETIWDLETGLGGGNLPGVFLERAAFSRAALKRPDILIFDKALASHDADSRARTRNELRDLMPEATLIFMEDEIADPEHYDLTIEIRDGRIDGLDRPVVDGGDGTADDLQRKLRLIGRTELFAELDGRNQRLLAFSAAWYKAKAGQTIFAQGDPADAVYLCVDGTAEISWINPDGDVQRVSLVEPGRVIGDQAVITGRPRELQLTAVEDAVFLRIGARQYMTVVESDPQVALSLLRTVSGYLTDVVVRMRQAGLSIPRDDEDDATGADAPEAETQDRPAQVEKA